MLSNNQNQYSVKKRHEENDDDYNLRIRQLLGLSTEDVQEVKEGINKSNESESNKGDQSQDIPGLYLG